MRRVPGVKEAGAIDFLPLIGGASMGVVKVGDRFEMVENGQMLPGYFEAAGIRLVAGRLPVESDLHGPPSVVISEDAAARFFGRDSAVGRRIWLDDNTTREVIGVVGTDRHRTMLFVLLGGFGPLLALVGVFSMTAYAVASRTREIGVRMALGAWGGEVVSQVVRDTAWPIALGIAMGTLAATAANRVIASFLSHTPPTDATTFSAVAAGLLLAGGLAAWWPARQAARVDPAQALRAE